MVEQVHRLVLVAAMLAAGLLGAGLTAAQSPPTTGTINTNVFDGVSGRYAEGMKVELVEVMGEAVRPVAVAIIDAKGRADLVTGRALAIGQYELRFQVADYYRARGVRVGDPPYLDYIPMRFSVDTPTGHYHLPLICTPWSYSTYRGN